MTRYTGGRVQKLKRASERRGYAWFSIRVRVKKGDDWTYTKRRKVELRTGDGPGGASKRALERAWQELHDEQEEVPGGTVADLVETWWGWREGAVSALTVARDRPVMRRVVDGIGRVPLGEFGPPAARAWIRNMREDGLSEDQVFKAVGLLRRVLKQAAADGVEVRDISGVVVPRPRVTHEKKTNRRLDRDGVRVLLGTLGAEGWDGYQIGVLLGVTTGMRRGEVLGLNWGAVDLGEHVLHVRAQFGKEGTLKAPKTRASRRGIHLDEGTVEALETWKRTQGLGDGAVVTGPRGGRIGANELGEHFRELMKNLGLGGGKPYVGPSFHSLRRAHATLLVADGVDPKTVQARLGHESLGTTLSLYAEAEAGGDAAAAKAVGGWTTS